ncbi:MAG: pilus assembly protein PilZ, partial [Pseudomonadota bacterium]
HRLAGLTQRQIERFVYQLQREARRDQAADRFS